MIQHHIEHLESRIRSADGISDEQRAELLGLLASMRKEAATLPELEAVPAGSEAEAAADDRPIEEVASEFQNSLTEFEASHPRLTQLGNQIAVVLSNMGI